MRRVVRVSGVAVTLAALALVAACSETTAPVASGGRVVFRVEASSAPAAAGARRLAAEEYDSVVVNVFRAGQPIVREATASAAVDTEPVELSLRCVAEAGKRVGVDLFQDGVMVYHGASIDVDVAADRDTPVIVDAFAFVVSAIDVTPGVVSSGATFRVSWNRVTPATGYVVEVSRTPGFESIEWETSVNDTLVDASLAPGAHYVRVAPRTPFTTGSAGGPGFGYVTGGSGAVTITGFSAPGAIPGDEVSVLGTNLDYPGTQVMIGALPMTVVSASYSELVVRMPRGAVTDAVSVSSTLGADTSPDPLVALRVAYVTMGGEYADTFVDLADDHADDIGESGVAVLPVTELDTRDMGVFDIIVVAGDTGTNTSNWAGNPARAAAIVGSGANVLAMGDGGSAFLRLGVLAAAPVTSGTNTSCYAASTTAGIFTTPHAISINPLNPWFDVCKDNERYAAFQIQSLAKPSNVTLYASTGIFSDTWILADVRITDGLSTRRYFFWGWDADPKDLTSQGRDCLANILNLLYKERPVSPVH